MLKQKPEIKMSSTKNHRLESKKRKVQAFLDLASQDQDYLNYRKKRFVNRTNETEEGPNCSLSSLRAQVREYKKYRGPPPSFELLQCGIQAQINLAEVENPAISSVPLYIADVQQMLLKAVLNLGCPCRPRWCSLYQNHLISHVHLMVVEGLSKCAIAENQSFFQNMKTVFDNMAEVITPCRYSSTFAAELCELPIFSYEVMPNSEIKNWNVTPCNTHKPLASIVPVTGDQVGDRDPDEGFSRLHLLLSPIQMAMEKFPFPQKVFQDANTKGYKMTRDVYAPVTSKSPMFAIDCEMCRVSSGKMEVTRVAVVDEKLQTVYCTLVKPRERIVDYVTKYSGVTEKMLERVTTSLEDVQSKIKELLPPDAILCGQSLNFDLQALRMIHPYIIDTSVIYNTSGVRTRKTALKVLSSTFLKQKIQNNMDGHHPVEDCIAAMKLVQLKLQNGPQFGDSILASRASVKTETDENTQCNSCDSSTSFFAQFPSEKKTALIVVNENFSDLYSNMLNKAVTKVAVANNRGAMRHTLKEMPNYDFTVSHLRFPTHSNILDSFSKIDNCVGKLYEACSGNSVFVFVGTGLKSDGGECENGFCCVKIKNQ